MVEQPAEKKRKREGRQKQLLAELAPLVEMSEESTARGEGRQQTKLADLAELIAEPPASLTSSSASGA